MKRSLKSVVRVSLLIAAGSALASTASAAVVFSANDPGGTGNNFVSASCTGGTGQNTAANPVIGCLNGQPTTLVTGLGTELLKLPSGGQARIEASDGGFTDLTIGFFDPGSYFDLLIFNIANPTADGSVSFSALLSNGNTVTSSNFALDDNGQNFFTIASNGGTLIDTLTITTTVDMNDVRQIRFGDILRPMPPAVPEPATLSLFGLGMAALGLRQRRR